MGQITLGYKPSGNARGVGTATTGYARATYLGKTTQPLWVVRGGARMGKNGSATAYAAPVLYSGTSSTSGPSGMLARTDTFTLTTIMYGNDPATGRNYEGAVQDVALIPAGTHLYASIWVAGGDIAHGQSHGPVMWQRTGTASAPPDPFGGASLGPEGQLDSWWTFETNTTPRQPIIVTPGANTVTVDPTPAITISFDDADEDLGDTVSKWLIELWDGTNTTRIKDSGVQANTLLTWTPTALAAARYTARAYTWDAANAKSEPRQWSFTVNSGGIFEPVAIHPTWNVGTNAAGDTVVNETTQGLSVTWTHDSGASTASITSRIINADTGAVVRSEQSGAYTFTDGQTVGWTYADFPEWAPLPRGATRYQWQFKGVDTFGSESPWASSDVFVVNDVPSVSIENPVSGISVSSTSNLNVIIQVDDTSDAAGSHEVVLDISTDDFATWTEHIVLHVGDGEYRTGLTSTHLPALATYQLRATAADPWGLDATSSMITLNYVAPPAVAITVPTGTITTGTPTVTATVDRTVSDYRVRITDDATGAVHHDSGTVVGSGSGVSHPVPAGLLRNVTDYTITLEVTTSDGLTATETGTFRVEYPAPWYLSGVTLATEAASVFDTGHLPQESVVRVSHDRIDESVVSDADFLGYVYRRYDGNGIGREWLESNRDTTSFVDRSAPAGVPVSYQVGYRQTINAGVDTIESEMVTVRGTVTLRHTTITHESSDRSVTLPYWRDRAVQQVIGASARVPLGRAKPYGFQDATNFDTVRGTFQPLTDPNDAYTARAMVDAARDLAAPAILPDGTTGPQPLWYRDPTGRAFRFMFTEGIDTEDFHRTDRAEIEVEGTEVAAPELVTMPAPVTTRDMTGVVEPSLLLPLDGSLAGEDRAGPMTATGTGALRFVDGYAEGSQAAFVEEGTTNLARNPAVDPSVSVTPNTGNFFSGWAATNAAINPVNNDPYVGTQCIAVVADGSSVKQGVNFYANLGNYLPLTPYTVTPSIAIKGSGGVYVANTIVFYTDSTNASVSEVEVSVSSNGWDRYTLPTITTDPAKTVNYILGQVRTKDSRVETFHVDASQFEQKAYATSFCPQLDADGNLLPGYTWTGTAHASASTRAAGSVEIARSVSTEEGSMLVRFDTRGLPRKMDRWYYADPVALGSSYLSNGSGAYVALTTVPSSNVYRMLVDVHSDTSSTSSTSTEVWLDIPEANGLPDYLTVYMDWKAGDYVRLHVVGEGLDSGLIQDSAGDVWEPQHETFGDTVYVGYNDEYGEHVNAGVDSLLIFDRPLTDAERSQLVSADQWSWNGLLATP